jgi:cytidylate kinase
MTLVAISAAYGAGGSRVGPAVAERLGVPFVDRAIPMAVAEQLQVPLDDATAHNDQATGGGWLERMLRGFIGIDTSTPTPLPADTVSSEDFHRATEEVIAQQAATGKGVILGRGAAVLLRDDPRVLRVRLTGPAERRIAQAMAMQNLDRETAERGLRQADSAHAEYIRQFYGVHIDDPTLYHLTLDSTSVPLDGCVELIVQAAGLLQRSARATA